MEAFAEILEVAVLAMLELLGYALLLRAILGLFASEESRVLGFCYAVTEPFVSPVRNLLSLIPALEDFPIDLSFMATYLILTICRIVLLSAF